MQSLNIFMKQIEHLTYAQKCQAWQSHLQKNQSSEDYLLLLGTYLEYFPFNHTYWLEYIKSTKFQQYITALKRNPKSYELWESYLQNCKLVYESQPQKYKKELERGIIEIGADVRSLHLYLEYYEMIGQSSRYQFFKKVFMRGLIGLEQVYHMFQQWWASLTEKTISQLAVKQMKIQASSLTFQEQKQHLQTQITTIYQKTLEYRTKRQQIQNRITVWYFDGSYKVKEELPYWFEFYQIERDQGVVENTSYCYERSLMAQSDNIEVWQEAFHYLENQTNKYSKVLGMLRNNRLFFLKFHLPLYFYWCDMEERQNPSVARKMYTEVAKDNQKYQIYERWIQFEIRQRQYANAKSIYDSMISAYQEDFQLLCYVLVEYGDFVQKYYKDLDYANKLLKGYFDYLPFSEYLFFKYLEFMKNFENKQGYYDELMQIINFGMRKAKKNQNDGKFNELIKLIKYYLRSTLSSIYLIKLSERKMLAFEESIIKENSVDAI